MAVCWSPLLGGVMTAPPCDADERAPCFLFEALSDEQLETHASTVI